MSGATRVEYTFYYLGLLLFLAVMMNEVHEMPAAAHAVRGQSL